jgi:predicted ATPase
VRALFAQCVEEPVARVLLVTAAPGMGKSLLRREVLSAITRAGAGEPAPAVRVWTARGNPMRAGSPFGLVAQLTPALRVSAGETLPISAQAQAAWLEALTRECEAGPVLLVLEDLQWGDAVSVKMLDGALRDLRDHPLMVLAFARPEVHELFPKLWADRAVEEIRLTALTRTASERLVRGVLGAPASASEVAQIIEQADGIPFSLEALARAAVLGEGEKVPDAALAMVQSRFEKLDADARKVLRAASIFGRTFWEGGVRTLAGGATEVAEGLADLLEAKMISQRPESRFAGEHEYEFCTMLAREGAYAMLTDADRSLGHALAGEWLERAGEQDAAVISGHRELGGRRRADGIERHASG